MKKNKINKKEAGVISIVFLLFAVSLLPIVSSNNWEMHTIKNTIIKRKIIGLNVYKYHLVGKFSKIIFD